MAHVTNVFLMTLMTSIINKVIKILQHTSVFLRNCFLTINKKKTGNNMKKVNKFC